MWKFWSKLTPEERAQMDSVLATAYRLIGALDAQRPVIDALIEAHPNPNHLREVLYPKLLDASLEFPTKPEAHRKSYQDELRRLMALLGDVPSTRAAPQSGPASPSVPGATG